MPLRDVPLRDVAYRVCFVCSGNICRSPIAEAVLRSALADAGLDGLVAVDSAGTGDWHVGEPADPRAASALDARGYVLEHRARQWEPDWFDERDLVVALDRGHARALRRLAGDQAEAAKVVLLRDFDPDADGEPDVPDPYYGPDAGFDEVVTIVERAAPALVAHVRSAVTRG